MRRNMLLIVGLAALVGGCGMFSAHSDVIEEAGGQNFTAEELARLLTSVKGPMQYNVQTGQFVTALWTDMTLFSQAVAANKLVTDSALVADAMWPEIAQATASRWMDTVLTRRAKVSDAAVDSAYKADQVRAVQHILVKVDSTAPKEDKIAARKKIDSLLAELKHGASFSKLAYENTDDLSSKPDSGYYGLNPRARWDPPFGKALWSLKPGEISGVVVGHYGFHIVRRPSDSESVRFWRDSLTRAIAAPIMTSYQAELVTANNVKVDGAAIPHMRAALDDLDGHQNDHTALTTFKDGSFTTGDFVRWMRAVSADPAAGAGEVDKFKAAPDSQFVKVLNQFTQTALLLREAQHNGIRLTPAEWKQMEDAFASAVDTVKTNLGLVPPALDPKASASERSKAAALRVDQFFNDLVDQKVRVVPLPGVLSATLRARETTKFNAVALQHGLDLALAKHAADSIKAVGPGGAGGAATPGSGMKPAPGPAPVGGASPAPSAPPKKP